MAFVVAIAGMMLPAIAGKEGGRGRWEETDIERGRRVHKKVKIEKRSDTDY